jgi:hypothetical protein
LQRNKFGWEFPALPKENLRFQTIVLLGCLSSTPFSATFGPFATGIEGDIGQTDDFGEVGKWVGGVRNRRGGDEMFLKARFDRRFDFVDLTDYGFDFAA